MTTNQLDPAFRRGCRKSPLTWIETSVPNKSIDDVTDRPLADSPRSGCIFVVAPNLIAAEKTRRKLAGPKIRSVLRCHERPEIGRVGAYFDPLQPNCKRRRTRWRSE